MKHKTLRFLACWFVLNALNALFTLPNSNYRAHIFMITPAQAKTIKTMVSKPNPKRLFTPPLRQWMNTLAAIESTDNYEAISRSGTYIGRYQLGKPALLGLGLRINTKHFRRNPATFPPHAQDMALLHYTMKNRETLQPLIKIWAGKKINGIPLTEASILGAAHGGAGRVSQFLRTKGGVDSADGNGTRVSSYLRRFARNPPVNFNRVKVILAQG